MVARRAISGLLAAVVFTFAAAATTEATVEDPATKPNIILILTDDQDHSDETLSKMPYLATRTGWYRFTNAFINNATCCPSRATILSGEWSHHTGVETTGGAPPFDDLNTVECSLRAAGYTTGYFGKWHLGPLNQQGGPTYVPPCWDDFIDHRAAGGPYYNYELNDNGVLVQHGESEADYSVDVLRDEVLQFIDTQAVAQRPFFAMFAGRGPHNNWTPAPRHEGAYTTDLPTPEPVTFPPSWNEDTSDKPDWWQHRPEPSAGNRSGAMRKEWEALLAVDDAVEAIHKRVRSLGLMNDTVIVFMSDNGYSFGEHRWGNKRCVYDSCARTPLLVKFGGHSEGTVFPQITGNEDLAPTFSAISGATPPEGADGQSFYDLLRYKVTPEGWQDWALLRSANPNDDPGSPPDAWAIRTPTHLYAETRSTTEAGLLSLPPYTEYELYDLAADPYQLTNLALDPTYDATEADLAGQLDAVRAMP